MPKTEIQIQPSRITAPEKPVGPEQSYAAASRTLYEAIRTGLMDKPIKPSPLEKLKGVSQGQMRGIMYDSDDHPYRQVVTAIISPKGQITEATVSSINPKTHEKIHPDTKVTFDPSGLAELSQYEEGCDRNGIRTTYIAKTTNRGTSVTVSLGNLAEAYNVVSHKRAKGFQEGPAKIEVSGILNAPVYIDIEYDHSGVLTSAQITGPEGQPCPLPLDQSLLQAPDAFKRGNSVAVGGQLGRISQGGQEVLKLPISTGGAEVIPLLYAVKSENRPPGFNVAFMLYNGEIAKGRDPGGFIPPVGIPQTIRDYSYHVGAASLDVVSLFSPLVPAELIPPKAKEEPVYGFRPPS